MINFGKYDQKVIFQSLGQVEDGYGGYIPTYTTVLSTFARSIQVKGSNDLESAQLELPKTYKFGVQVRSGFVPNESMQISYKGFQHVIKGIEVREERNSREWIITAVRV